MNEATYDAFIQEIEKIAQDAGLDTYALTDGLADIENCEHCLPESKLINKADYANEDDYFVADAANDKEFYVAIETYWVAMISSASSGAGFRCEDLYLDINKLIGRVVY